MFSEFYFTNCEIRKLRTKTKLWNGQKFSIFDYRFWKLSCEIDPIISNPLINRWPSVSWFVTNHLPYFYGFKQACVRIRFYLKKKNFRECQLAQYSSIYHYVFLSMKIQMNQQIVASLGCGHHNSLVNKTTFEFCSKT